VANDVTIPAIILINNNAASYNLLEVKEEEVYFIIL